MNDLERFLARFPQQPGTPHVESLKITVTVHVKDERGHRLIDLTRSTTQWIDNGKQLRMAEKAFRRWFTGTLTRQVCSLFGVLVDKIRDSVACGERADPEFPSAMVATSPGDVHWNDPVSVPVYLPGFILPLHGAQTRSPFDPGHLEA